MFVEIQKSTNKTKDKTLSYLVLHTPEEVNTVGASIDSEETIQFL